MAVYCCNKRNQYIEDYQVQKITLYIINHKVAYIQEANFGNQYSYYTPTAGETDKSDYHLGDTNWQY